MIVDVVGIMLRKPDLFTLERAVILLPSVYRMLESQYEENITVGLSSMMLFATSFSDLMKQVLNNPVTANSPLDFGREDREERCRILAASFVRASPKVNSLSRRGGKLGQAAKQLAAKLREINLPNP